MPAQKKIVSQYARLWPREVFDITEGNKLLVNKVAEELKSPGV